MASLLALIMHLHSSNLCSACSKVHHSQQQPRAKACLLLLLLLLLRVRMMLGLLLH
jgi:hypothetical protein